MEPKDGKIFVCEYCGYKTIKQSTMKNHKEAQHMPGEGAEAFVFGTFYNFDFIPFQTME